VQVGGESVRGRGGVSARRRTVRVRVGGGKCERGRASARGKGRGREASLKVCCFTSCHYCSPIVFLAYPFVQCTCTYT
jgi:hypothetical protein